MALERAAASGLGVAFNQNDSEAVDPSGGGDVSFLALALSKQRLAHR